MRLLVQLSVLRDRGNINCHAYMNISDINNGTNYFKYRTKLIFMAILVTVTSFVPLGFHHHSPPFSFFHPLLTITPLSPSLLFHESISVLLLFLSLCFTLLWYCLLFSINFSLAHSCYISLCYSLCLTPSLSYSLSLSPPLFTLSLSLSLYLTHIYSLTPSLAYSLFLFNFIHL